MQTSQTINEISKAIISVMKAVKGIDKSMTVGTGNSSYKGVSDKDVKVVIGKEMENNGLCIVPVDVEPTLQIDRWTETGQYGEKQKQAVFTSVKTKYLLLHESGEWIEFSGYGHGVDSQDKAAGKATTYALKYALLYIFMVPTGKIDDADTTHSDELQTPNQNGNTLHNHKKIEQNGLPLITNVQFKKACDRVEGGELDIYYKVKADFSMTPEQLDLLTKLYNKAKKQPA